MLRESGIAWALEAGYRRPRAYFVLQGYYYRKYHPHYFPRTDSQGSASSLLLRC